ncbi:uncharacterized protein EKO05_0006983 [Ascochyta rabiei]|uniref:uncharacterized protein n=1 Tax=Didymella rabiei TaxID=5454 RepID=UPI0022046E5F|nr:uncharacterized protein EKO05_0006983 [Ascochyta rabiei]UPX16592.1 hypothetical protein EKO05_0006983 [Ascochyta rabiei]
MRKYLEMSCKWKCSSRLPSVRDEGDGVGCRIEREPPDEELSRSCIATFEGQHLSFLAAVRDLQTRHPNDSKANSVLQQLQASGFDLELASPPIHPFTAAT